MNEWAYEHHLARQRGHDIAEIRMHWGEAYKIDWDWEKQKFWATRRDDWTRLEAETAAELRTRIRDDFTDRPVPWDARADCTDR